MLGTVDFWSELRDACSELPSRIDDLDECRYVKVAAITPSTTDRESVIFLLREIDDRVSKLILEEREHRRTIARV